MQCDAPIFLIFLVYTDLRFFSIRTFANIIVIIIYNWPFPCTCACVRAVANLITAAQFRAVINHTRYAKYTHEYLMSRPEGGTCPWCHPPLDPPLSVHACIRAAANRGTVSCGSNRTRYAKYTHEYLMVVRKGGGGGTCPWSAWCPP